MDYIQTLESFKKIKKQIKIATNIIKIEELESKLNEIKENQNIKNNLKSFGLSAKKNCPDFLSNIYKNMYIDKEIYITEEVFNKIKELHQILDKDFIEILKNQKFSEIKKLNHEIILLKEGYKMKILGELENIIENSDNHCPVCGTEVENLKDLISEKLNEKNDIENYKLEILNKLRLDERQIELIIKYISEINEEEFIIYLISGGDFAMVERINSSVKTIENTIANITELKKEKTENYKNLLKYKEILVNTFKIKYPMMELKFEDDKNEIIIDLPRDVKQYSTGEINFMLFNVKLYEFFGSNKKLLIIDDILTSYDKSNQYTLIYLLCKLFNENKNKKFVCFTHNFETLRIAKYQVPGIANNYIIEKIEKNLIINKIDIDVIEKKFNNAEESAFKNEYINLLIKRKVSDKNDKIHGVFHYDERYGYDNFTNDNLVSNITSFDINNIDNKNIVETKIILFISLRVFIEKVIFDNIDEEERKGIKGKLFGEKINHIFSNSSNRKINGFNRNVLLAKKVMINDSLHLENRMHMIFDYIFNLSLDELVSEIMFITKLSKKDS